MHTATRTSSRRTKHAHPIRHLLNGHRYHGRRHPGLSNKIAHAYTFSVKKIRKKPYKAAGLALTLGVLSSIALWLRYFR